MLVKAVLCDLDGVLLDTFRSGLHKIHTLCAIHEVPFGRATRAKLTNAWGMPAIELLMHCLEVNRALATEMNRVWEKLDTTDPPQLIPGAREVLLWLRHNKFKTALITSMIYLCGSRRTTKASLRGYTSNVEAPARSARRGVLFQTPSPCRLSDSVLAAFGASLPLP